MSRDTDDALRKLQDALWEEDAQEAPFLTEEEIDALSDQDIPSHEPKSVRNYTSGYKVYNSDKTDTDLDTFSETVRVSENPRPRGKGLFAALLFLLTVAVVATLLLYLYKGGFF